MESVQHVFFELLAGLLFRLHFQQSTVLKGLTADVTNAYNKFYDITVYDSSTLCISPFIFSFFRDLKVSNFCFLSSGTSNPSRTACLAALIIPPLFLFRPLKCGENILISFFHSNYVSSALLTQAMEPPPLQ